MADPYRLDPERGTVEVALPHLYGRLIAWHIDECTDTDGAVIYARRFICTLCGEPDEASWDELLRQMPDGLRRELDRLETDDD